MSAKWLEGGNFGEEGSELFVVFNWAAKVAECF